MRDYGDLVTYIENEVPGLRRVFHQPVPMDIGLEPIFFEGFRPNCVNVMRHIKSSCWMHGVTNLDRPEGCGCDVYEPPKYFGDHVILSRVIIHLNDSHYWSREKIADWLDEMHDKGIVDLTLTSPHSDRA